MSDEPRVLTVEEMLATPEMQAAIQAKLDAEVTGLKNKNAELIDKNKKAIELAKNFEGLDVAKLKELQKQIDGNEEMKLLSEGKHEEIVARRTENMRRDLEAQIAAREGLLSEKELLIKQKDDRLKELVIDGQVREAYVALDFEPSAMDDVLRLGRTTFIMDESGKAVPRDKDGNMIFGKDGKTPITASEWLTNLSETKKYLRRASSGAGAKGAGAGSGSGKHVDTSKLSAVQRIAIGLQNGGLS